MNKKHIYDISGMSDQQIVEIVKNIASTQNGCGAMRTINAKANKPLHDAIVRLTNFFNTDEYSFVNMSTRTYMLINGLSEKDFPRCIHCKKIIKKNVVSIYQGFPNEACSMTCAAMSEQRHQKIAKTNLERHGKARWSNGAKISEALKNMDPKKRNNITQKSRRTRQKNIENNPSYWKDRDAKTKQTKQAKYGDENWNNPKSISNTKQMKSEADPNYYIDAMKKGQQTKLQRYGDENFVNVEQIKHTKLQKYGDENWNNREKAIDTCLQKYGVENPSQFEQTKQSIRETCLHKYGVECCLQSDAIKQQIKQTCLEKYGAPSFMSSEEGKKLLSLNHSKQTYSKILLPAHEAEPLFSFDEIIDRTPLTEFKWKCKTCGEIFYGSISSKNSTKVGQFARCPKCYPPSTNASAKQCEVYNFVRSILPNDDVLLNTRKQIKPYEIDIYVPRLKLGIEFDGLYWHSAFHRCDDNAIKFKTDLCLNNKIQLIHMFEDEWDIRKEQCKALLKQYLVKEKAKSANLAVVSIDETTALDFFKSNSIEILPEMSSRNYALVDSTSKKVLLVATGYQFNGSYALMSFCQTKDISANNLLSIFLHRFKDMAKNQRIVLKNDRRWPLVSTKELQLAKTTQCHRWLIEQSKTWRRICKLTDNKILQNKYGMLEDEDLFQFLESHNLTYVCDAGHDFYEIL